LTGPSVTTAGDLTHVRRDSHRPNWPSRGIRGRAANVALLCKRGIRNPAFKAALRPSRPGPRRDSRRWRPAASPGTQSSSDRSRLGWFAGQITGVPSSTSNSTVLDIIPVGDLYTKLKVSCRPIESDIALERRIYNRPGERRGTASPLIRLRRSLQGDVGSHPRTGLLHQQPSSSTPQRLSPSVNRSPKTARPATPIPRQRDLSFQVSRRLGERPKVVPIFSPVQRAG